jgi:phosphosulfolactate synthase
MAGPPLDLPARAAKPREHGITHLMDRGLSVAEVDNLMEVAGHAVDIVKLGFGTALATGNLEVKLDRYAAHGVPVVLGGTVTELAIQQGRVGQLVGWVRDLGLHHVEVSDGTITLDHGEKVALVRRLVGEGFVVLSEVGSKDDERIMAPYRWVELIQAELEAGAWKVICEARETGTAGIARPDGELRQGLIDEIAHAVDPGRIIFEAPQKDQQVHLIRRFGPDVNLGNIPPADVLPLETMRLGLRSDTMEST